MHAATIYDADGDGKLEFFSRALSKEVNKTSSIILGECVNFLLHERE